MAVRSARGERGRCIRAGYQRGYDREVRRDRRRSNVPGPRAADDFESRAVDVRVTKDELIVDLIDGRRLSVPLTWFPRLLNASPAARRRWQLLGSGIGIHWPGPDEDISVAGLLKGIPSMESKESLARAGVPPAPRQGTNPDAPC